MKSFIFCLQDGHLPKDHPYAMLPSNYCSVLFTRFGPTVRRSRASALFVELTPSRRQTSSSHHISSHLITLRPDSPLQALHPHFLPRPLIDPDAIKLFIHNYNNWRWCRRARCIDRPPAQGTQSHRLREHQHSSDARRQSPDTTQCCTRSELLWSLGEIQRGRNNSEGEYDV